MVYFILFIHKHLIKYVIFNGKLYQHFYRCPLYVAVSKEYVTERQIILRHVHSAFPALFYLKFSATLVDISKSYARNMGSFSEDIWRMKDWWQPSQIYVHNCERLVSTLLQLWQHRLLGINWSTLPNKKSLCKIFFVESLKHIFA